MTDFRAVARQAAVRNGLDPNIFIRQINAESNFNPNAGSSAGAIGIAQFIPSTAASLGINPRDPVQSLNGAAKLMAGYVKKFGSYENALRAYNAGEGAVQKSRGYSETNAYVAKILNGRDPGKLSPPGGGGGSPGLGTTTTTTSNAAQVGAATEDNRRRAIALNFLKTSNPNSLIVKSGVLDPQVVPGLKQLSTTRVTSAGPSLPSAATSSAGRDVQITSGANRAGVKLQAPILSFLDQLSGVSKRAVQVTTGTNHNQFVAGRPGVQSDHWTGNASDLGVGGDARQSSAVNRKGSLIAAHAIQLASVQAGRPIGFTQAYSMAQRGGLWNFQTKAGRVQILWKTNQGGNHYNHVHIGVNPG